MRTARIVSYNADHYDPYLLSGEKYLYPDTGIENRFEHMPGLLSALEPDLVLMQELYSTNQAEIEHSIQYLSDATDLSCEWQGNITAAKSSHHKLGTGVLWGPRFKPESCECLPDFWQPLNIVHGSVDGQPVGGASYHAQPVGKVEELGDLRQNDTKKLAEFAISHAKSHPHLILGGDWNSLAAARYNDTWLDPEPTPEVPLHEVMTPLEVDFVLNRRPANVLHDKGLIDLAAHYALMGDTFPEATTGGRPTREGPQRLDRLYALGALAKRVCSVSVIKNDETDRLSDHYPLLVELDISKPKVYL